jgi:drug/metabolite transporter (DMT)-like permease
MTIALRNSSAYSFQFSLSPKLLALLALLFAQLAIALGVFCIKLSVSEIGSLGTIFNRFWIAGVVFLVWHQTELGFSKASQQRDKDAGRSPATLSETSGSEAAPPRNIIAIFLGAGMIWAACLVLWACSLEYTNIANSTLMHDLSPLFAIVLGWLLFKHHFNGQFLVAVGITLLGVVVIGIEDVHVGMDHLFGDALALLSAVFLALYCLLVGHLRSHYSSTAILQWICLFGSLSLIPVIFLASGTFLPVTAMGWLAIAGVVCLSQIIGQGLTAYSLKEVSSELASLFFPLEAVFVAIVAWIGLGEHLTLLNCLGFALVLAGIYVALLSPPAPSARAE